jgi:hypothetical protein
VFLTAQRRLAVWLVLTELCWQTIFKVMLRAMCCFVMQLLVDENT